MSWTERAGLALLHRLDPETAHELAQRGLRSGLYRPPSLPPLPRLRCNLAGIALSNPIGLAAGFDKNATSAGPLSRAGFGFLELGAVTPLPQTGNPKPRLFRLPEDRAVINRFGFNNDGMDVVAARLASRPRDLPVGLNLGANKDSANRAGDFARVLARCGPHLDFATVNVSSPNTQGLRDLQAGDALRGILAEVLAVRDDLPVTIPIFLKISPDLDETGLREVAEAALETGIAAIIATNTTLARDGLHSRHRGEAGGLSGQPLFELSTHVLARLADITEGRLPLIGVGGIASAGAAYAKIRAGASAVQLYSALTYQGLSLVGRIAEGLDQLLARDGFASVSDAVGSATKDYLQPPVAAARSSAG